MDSHMFDGLVGGLLIIGFIIGVVCMLGFWSCEHYILPHIVFGLK